MPATPRKPEREELHRRKCCLRLCRGPHRQMEMVLDQVTSFVAALSATRICGCRHCCSRLPVRVPIPLAFVERMPITLSTHHNSLSRGRGCLEQIICLGTNSSISISDRPLPTLLHTEFPFCVWSSTGRSSPTLPVGDTPSNSPDGTRTLVNLPPRWTEAQRPSCHCLIPRTQLVDVGGEEG